MTAIFVLAVHPVGRYLIPFFVHHYCDGSMLDSCIYRARQTILSPDTEKQMW